MSVTSLLDPVRLKPGDTRPEIDYPESDGKPLGETDFHISAILYLRQALRFFFRRMDDIYVAADMLFYYEEGEPTVFKVPDVFVVKGVAKHDRRTYKLWEEGVAPAVIFEITSRSTRWEDTGEKRGLYQVLGVREYYLFDPMAEYLKPRLQGFRLEAGVYRPLSPARDGALTGQELGVILRPEGALLRVVDPATGESVPALDEAADLLEDALEQVDGVMQRARAEAQRADVAEAEAARLRLELEHLRRQGAGDR